MKRPILQYIDNFTVTGFSVRTQNSDELKEGTAKLPKLWRQFYASNLTNNTNLFGVYSDYESDANGHYTVTAGVIGQNQGNELNSIKIMHGNYLMFRRKGAMPTAVIAGWQDVWAYFAAETKHQRSFITDFEVYNSSDGVNIFIGIK